MTFDSATAATSSISTTASIPTAAVPATNFTVKSVFTAMGMAVVIHRAEGLEKLPMMGTIKAAVTFSITRKGTALDSLQTAVKSKGGSNPNFDSYGELMFNSTPSTIKDDRLVLEVNHHGDHLGKRFLGKALVPLQLLTAGNGTGIEISYPLLRSDKEVGNIIVSHEIKRLEDLISLDPAAETDTGGTATLGGRRFRWSDAFGAIADGVTLLENSIELFGG